MRVTAYVVAVVLLSGVAGAEERKPVGVVGLRTESLSRPVAALVNEQLAASLEAVANRSVVTVRLGKGKPGDDIAAMRAAAALSDVWAVVGGSVSSTQDPGEVRLLLVPADDKAPVVERRIPVPGNSESAQRAAIDAATCALVGTDGDTSSCQSTIELDTDLAAAELDLDGRRVLKAGDVAGTAVDVGSHVARGCIGENCSTARRLDVTRDLSISLRIIEDCKRLHLLGPSEPPDCGGVATTEVVPLIIEAPATNWKAIVTTGVGGAALVAGAIFGLQANAAQSELETGYANGGLSRDAATASRNAMDRNATLANVSFIVGGLAAAAGVGMFVFDL